MATAPSPDQSLPPNPPLTQDETAPDAQPDTGNVQATSALDTLKGPAPSLEAYANFNSGSPPTVLRNVSEGKPIPPEDLIDLTNEADEENDMEKFTQGFSAPKQSSKRRRMEDNKLWKRRLFPSNFGTNLPILPQHSARTIGEVLQLQLLKIPLKVTATPLLLISAGQGADTATSIPSSTGPEIPINPVVPTPTAPVVNQSSIAQPGSNSTGPPAESTNPTTSDGPAPLDPDINNSTPPPPPIIPSLILDESIRCDVHSILKNFQGNLNRQKFKQAHLAVHTFIDCRAKSMHKRTPPPELPQFALVQSESSHAAWLKDIQNIWTLYYYLSHPAALKTQGHVEYPLALLLLEIQQPSKFILSQWSSCIASSIQLTARELTVEPASLSDLDHNNLDSHLRILEYLNSCSAVADVETDETSSESQALVVQKKELDKHRSRHNYTPFCLYLVAGVRGLILAPNNRQFASGASALGFLSAVEHIFNKNVPRHDGLESVWKRLGAYIDSLFIDSFLTPNCLFNFHQPQIMPLAQAITSDFLACIQNKFPARNFKLPRAVTAK
ncbi:hypothetical protein KEM48_011163 [Puccinia striiformis f. sp. tritici PST-130]|nr:hypothetical protein KEM48_011163 [Puccinia striiformis f. sp. tritici PST-130]